MDLWTILILAIGPGLAWLLYFYAQDRFEPEPLQLVAKVFFLGMVATIPTYILESICLWIIPSSGVLYQAVAVPIIEESCKFLPVYLYVFRQAEFDEPMDGIVYATASALGFASVENVLYLTGITTLTTFMVTGVFRAIFSVPNHALFSVLWGHALGIAKFRHPRHRTLVVASGLLLGVAFHGTCNFLLLGGFPGFALLILVAVPVIWWIAQQRMENVLIPA